MGLSISRVTWGLVGAAAYFVMAHLVSEAVAELWGEPAGVRHFFTVDAEANPEAWYSTLQLLFCAVLLTIITRSEFGRAHRWYWGMLAAGFYYLGLDEGAHEALTPLVRTATGIETGIFRMGWIIPGIAVVALVGLCYLRFLFLLPRRTAVQFAVGGVIYITGLIGFEIIGSLYKQRMAAARYCIVTGDCGYGYSVIAAVEEAMEMIGITIFANALMQAALSPAPNSAFASAANRELARLLLPL